MSFLSLPNIEFDFNINDLPLEKHISFLEYFVKNKPLIDIEKNKPKNVKGFYACSKNHNQKRNNKIYSIPELVFKKIIDKHKVNFIHEHRIKAKNSKLHIYHLDFFIYDKRIDIEINPSYHDSYSVVRVRDKLKKHLLKEHYHIKTVTVTVNYKRVNGKLKPVLKGYRKALNIIKNAPLSCETLLHYL